MFKQVVDVYRRSFIGLSVEVWWLSLVLLINRSGTMVAPFLTIYLLRNLHYTLTQAGIVNAMLGGGAVLGALIGGRLTDRVGHVSVQLAALIGGSVFFVLLGYLQHFAAICVATFLLGMVNDAFRPANSAAIAAYSTPDNRTRSYTLNRLAINMGWAVGVTAGGILAGINYRLLFWVDGITNLAAGILLWRVLYKPGERAIKKQKQKILAKGSSPYKDKIYLRFILLTTVFGSCFMLVFRILPPYYSQVLQLPEPLIGVVMGLNGVIIAFFEIILVSRWEDKRAHLTYIRWGCYLIAVTFLCLLLPVNAIALAFCTMVLFTFSEILAMPFMNTFMINRASEANRDSYAAVYTIAWSVSQIAGPYLGAVLVDYFSYQALWVTAAALCAFCGLAAYFLKETNAVAID